MKSSELYIPAARRFPNVTESNILCLLEGVGEHTEFGFEGFTVSLGTVHSTPSFLFGLSRAFVGGRLKVIDDDNALHNFAYMPHACIGPERHDEIIRGLIFTTSGAFMSGLLSPNLSTIRGINSFVWNLARGKFSQRIQCLY